MKVVVLDEAGYPISLFGTGLSKGVTSNLDYEEFIGPTPEYDQMQTVVNKLCGKGDGHDKFLEFIQVWLDVTAPRYWWQEADTYRVGMSKLSESTMHTIHKRPISLSDFERERGYSDEPLVHTVHHLNTLRQLFIETQDKKAWRTLIQLLPQSYLQRRIISTNYGTLHRIVKQRKGHKLKEWAIFIEELKEQLQHTELLP